MTTTISIPTPSIGGSITLFTGNFGGSLAFTGTFRVFGTVGAAFLTLVVADFGGDFRVFFIALATFVKSVTNFAAANLAFFSSTS
jgi:hypothetical protein